MKDLTTYPAVKELINAPLLLKKSFSWVVIAAIIDALFFLAWGFFTTPIRDKITEHSILLANQLSTQMAEKPYGILSHLLSQSLAPNTGKLILLILMLFASIYIIYNIFHGTTWWIAQKISGQKITYRQYFIGFAKINIIWIAGYILYKFLDIIIALRHQIIQKIIPNAPNFAGKVLLLYLILLIIAAFLSYAKLNPQAIYKTPLKTSIPLVILSASIFLATQFILNSISLINLNLALATGLILLFPVITLIRVYSIRTMQHVHTRN